jgi:hypothetical protein
MAWQDLLAVLEPAWQKLDRNASGYCEGESPQIYCQPGCSNCCSLAVNCSFPEALAIIKALSPEQRDRVYAQLPALQLISQQSGDLKQYLRLFRDKIDGCPLLTEEGCCGIYPVRPFSCRALLSTRNSSWCAVDIAALHPLEKEAFLSSLEPELVAFPTHYLAATQELGLEFESQALSAMRDVFGIAISGNLIYLLWLEMEHHLSKHVEEGFVATQTFLEERQLQWPFLLQVQGEL